MWHHIAKRHALGSCALLIGAWFGLGGCHLGELVDAEDPDAPTDDAPPPDTSDQDPVVVATQLAFAAQPTDVTAGEPIAAITVEARDNNGEMVTDFSGTVTVSIASGPDGASLEGSLEREAVDGIAEFDDLTIERAWAGYTLSVSANELEAAVSESFVVEPGTAAAIEIMAGDDQVDSVAATLPDRFVATVIDEYENPVPGVAVAWDVVRGEGSIAPDGARTDEDGRVSARYTLGTIAGEQIVVAAVVGLSDVAATFVSRATPGQPASIVILGQPGNTGSGDPITPAVVARIVDQFENTATQMDTPVSVRLAPFTGTPLATLSGTLIRAPVSGTVTFDDLSIDLSGIGYRLRLTVESLSRDSRAFNVF